MQDDVNSQSVAQHANLESSPSQNEVNADTQTGEEIDDILNEAFAKSTTPDKEENKENNGEEEPTVEEEGKPKETEFPEAEKRKAELNREIRDLNFTLRKMRHELESHPSFKIPSLEDIRDYLMDQDQELTEAEATMEARLRIAEAKNIRNEQISAITDMRYEQAYAIKEATLEFPEIFDSKNSKFDREFANSVMEVFENVANVKRADNGEILSATAELAPFLRVIGQAYKLGQKSSENMALEQNTRAPEKTKTKPKTAPLYPSGANTSISEQDELKNFLNEMLT